MNNKTLSLSYYRKGIKTPVMYLLAGFVCIAFNLYFRYVADLKTAFWSIFNFTAAPYAWYVEMYIGLFLLIPFLNLIFNNLAGKKQHLVLLGTLFIMTSLPTVTNIFNFLTPEALSLPYDKVTYTPVLPKWWLGIYPLFYYFIGACIARYKPTINRHVGRLSIIIFVLFHAAFCCYRSGNGTFVAGAWSEWASPLIAIPATLLFILCIQKENRRFPSPVRRLLAKLSDLSFGAYLVSYVFDQHMYTHLVQNESAMLPRMLRYFVYVPLGFIGSMLISAVLELIYKLLKKAENELESFIKQKKAKADVTKPMT